MVTLTPAMVLAAGRRLRVTRCPEAPGWVARSEVLGVAATGVTAEAALLSLASHIRYRQEMCYLDQHITWTH